MSGALRFDHIWALGGLVLFIPLVLFDLFSPRRKREPAFLPPDLRRRLFASRAFFKIFLACFIIALSGPRWGLAPVAGENRRGLDVVVAVDVSGSMEIEDAPALGENNSGEREISRLERGLAVIRQTIAAVPGARFAAAVSRGRGLVAVPLTWDNGALLGFLEALDGSSLTGKGTNLESLVDAAAGAFQSSFPSKRVIILVSDGEALAGSLRAALDRCVRDAVVVSALAVGSDEGRPVPEQENVISRRDAAVMRMAASRTGGVYVDGGHKDAAALLAAHLRSLASESETGGTRREPKERWYLFVMASALAIGASKLSLLKFTNPPWRVTHSLLLFFVLFFPSCAKTSGKLLVMEANFLSGRGLYAGAISSYLRALEYDEAAPYAEYGLGSVYYSLDEGGAALNRFVDSQKLLENRSPAADRELRYRIHYNTGVIFFEREDFEAAAASFRDALRIDPAKIDAKRNLELSLLSIARKNAAGGQIEQRREESESREALFEYLRQKEQNQWKSREWVVEEETTDTDY
jgi:Ca-activated chloride channel family protein